jgi:flagellar motor switch protein FliN/FliY
MANDIKDAETSARIAPHLGQALAGALSAMTGKEFSVAAEPEGEIAGLDPADPDQSMVWQQAFSCLSEPALWLAAGKDAWATTGQMVLGDVGVDSATDEDCRSTWIEILGQAMSGLATALAADLRREITAAKGEEIIGEPEGLAWRHFMARCGNDGNDGEGTILRFKAAWSLDLAALYGRPEPHPKHTGNDAAFSKTLDLLLDVALPVNVSFGKTFIQIREVLKLNTGSIVELNRFVTEPVEVIVNDCVIARGEVVVVDGNYGVRITHLASREDRLRSGIADTSPKAGVPVR